MGAYEHLLVEQQGKTAIVIINREEKLNALNGAILKELALVLDVLCTDQTVRGVIITGKGERAFVAGADIKEFLELDAAGASELSRAGHENVMNKIQNFPKPIVAAVNGFALGGGLEIALACHLRVAVLSAKLGLPEVSLGIIPGYGGTQRLPKLVGKGLANELIFSAKMISAERAQEIGLVNEVFPQEELLAKTNALAEQISKNSPMGIAKAIESINLSDTDKGFEKEIISFGELFEMDDKKEGVAAFLEKRKPVF